MAAVVDNGGTTRGGLVCVTGGSGFIGLWLVRSLLDRGYTVHASVKNLRNPLFLFLICAVEQICSLDLAE
jgi:nucleoside-diphosphate-sugar epimerase